MSEQTTYTPLTTKPDNDFPLVAPTRGVEKELHKLQVRFAGVDLEERKLICNMENWEPQEVIPELAESKTVTIYALKGLVDRSKDNTAVRDNLEQLIESFDKDVEPVDPVAADDYWLKLAKLLLKGFDETFGNDANADDLNFKELQRAYNDFF